MANKKTKLRNRILVAFALVLFFSYLFTAVFFNVFISFYILEDTHRMANYNNIGGIGIVLAMLTIIAFVLSTIVSYFLSNSITRPIKKLEDFAIKIGKGGFLSNDFEFKDVELENLNNALNKSVIQLGEYHNAQENFFQNASHELRTPLMSIKCYAEGIVYELMEPKLAGETILTETDKLSELVTDLLYIAKIDSSTTAKESEKINLTNLIKEGVARQEAIANKNNISFVFEFDKNDIHYVCIKDLISRAIDNLISNAIRYAKNEIILTCKKEKNFITISITDDGDGIEADIMPYIFERFYKGAGGNTGIGLSIVKSIVKQHKGSVVAKNIETGGARFVIILPQTM